MLQFGAQPGSQLRGALFTVLRKHNCPLGDRDTVTPEHSAVCPVCALLSPRDEGAARGHTPPPPFAIKPPITDRHTYHSGERFSIGFTLLGDQSTLFPYVVHGMRTVGIGGVGPGRGTYRIRGITASNPLTATQQTLLDNHGNVRLPSIHITHADVTSHAATLSPDRITLNFQTPTRLIAAGKLCHQPRFDVLIARLLERLDLLIDQYAPHAPRTPYEQLNTLAAQVSLTDDRTRWLDVHSGSRRQGRTTPIGGFVGPATFTGPLSACLPWLLWGQFIQVGKNTSKGNGWYVVAPGSE